MSVVLRWGTYLMYGLTLATLDDGRKALIIRTSDRIAFKSCRRKWGFSSHLKMNLAPRYLAAPLWFGSAIHYALEDYHGYNKFGHPREAFKAYCISTAHNYKRELPSDAQEHYHLGIKMMDYYVDYWLARYPRTPHKTYWHPNKDGVLEPQVEVNFEIEIPCTPEQNPRLHTHMVACGADCVLYRGTLDGVAIDEYENLWVVEYKTAKVAQNTHYQTDPQVTTYVWATSLIYDKPIAGVIYMQFVKKEALPPRILANGSVSVAQNMVTSYPLYQEQLEALYGEIRKAPSKNQARLNELMKAETGERDRYIIREKIHRNVQQCSSEAQKILMELEDMLNPDLPLYPNPTRDCSRMCSFLTPCINMDDGSDWEALLLDLYLPRDNALDRMWRVRLPDPSVLQGLTQKGLEPDLEGIQNNARQDSEEYQAAMIAAGDLPPADWEEGGRKDPYEGMSENGTFNMAEVQPS